MMALATALSEAAGSQGGGTNEAVVIGMVVIGLAQVLNLVLTGKQLFTRQPPIDAEFATKAELGVHIERNAREHAELHSRLGGTERGWREKLEVVRAQVAAIDERSQSTDRTVRIMNQNLMEALRK